MSIVKFAQASVDTISIIPIEQIRKMTEEHNVYERFRRTTAALRDAQTKMGGKKLAPKVDDFLYAVAIMMHAAEAALINQVTGDPIVSSGGQPVRGNWEKITDSKGRDTVKWVSADGIKPFKNANGDIFPEEDLVAKHKEWVGKPLCKDHQSSSVDGIRGIVVDTFYDPKYKRVYALFALDRKNYPDLARKVEAGYATSVSMGTAVGRAICTECGNVATTEPEYCHHIKTRSNYGEINKDLSPIELSIVVTGADPGAKIKEVLASMRNYVENKETELNGLPKSAGKDKIESLLADIRRIESEVKQIKSAAVDYDKLADNIQALESMQAGDRNVDSYAKNLPQSKEELGAVSDVKLLDRLLRQSKRHNLEFYQNVSDVLAEKTKSDLSIGDDKGRSGVQNPPEDKTLGLQDSSGYTLNQEMANEQTPGNLLPTDFHQPSDMPAQAFSALYRNLNKGGLLGGLEHRVVSLANKIESLENTMKNKEKPMSFAELKERSLRRRQAYWQGTEEPAPGQRKYAPMGDSDKIRNTQDKQMVGDELNYGSEKDPLPAGDKAVKELMQRASLEERRLRRAQLLEQIQKSAAGGEAVFDSNGSPVGVKTPDGKVKPIAQAAKDKDPKKEKEEAKAKAEKEKEKEKKEKDKKDKEKKEKKAYWQGTEEPSPGQRKYAPMGDSDKIRNTQDKQMNGIVDTGSDDMFPGDDTKKKYWQRMANLKAKLLKGAASAARWDIYADDQKVMVVNALDVYGEVWNRKIGSTNRTFGEYFQGEEYGKRVLQLVREAAGPEGAAQQLDLPAPMAPAAPAPDAAPADKEDTGAHDKVMAAISAARDALDDAEHALGDDDLKDVNVPAEPAPEAGMPAAASAEDIRIVKAEVDAAIEELSYLEGQLDDGNVAVASVVDEAIDDTQAVIAHYTDLIQIFAAKKKDKDVKKEKMEKMKKEKDKEDKEKEKEKMKKEKEKKMKKSDSELLQDLLIVRAERRAELAAQAMENLDEEVGFSDEDLDRLLAEHEAQPTYDMMVDDMCAKDGKDKDKEDKDEEDEEKEEKAEKEDKKDEKDARDGASGGMGPEFNKPPTEGPMRDGMNAKDGKEDKADKKKEEAEEKEEKAEKDEKDEKAEKDEKDAADGATVPTETKMSRKQWRESLVAKAKAGGFQYMELYNQTRPGKGVDPGFDAKVSDELGLVENLATAQGKDLDVARSEPRNVRMAAQKLAELVAKGALDESGIAELVSSGAVDPAAAKYWKDFWKQSPDGGSEFGTEMSKDFEQHKKKASLSDEMEVREAKLRRAFALGLEAQGKGMISTGSVELNKYVDSLVNLPDSAFESIKNVVAQHKKAAVSSGLRVGLNLDNTEEGVVKTASAVSNGIPSFEDLSVLFVR